MEKNVGVMDECLLGTEILLVILLKIFRNLSAWRDIMKILKFIGLKNKKILNE